MPPVMAMRLIFALLLVTGLAAAPLRAQEGEAAFAVVQRSYELLAGDCQYDCAFELAGQHTDAFLDVIRTATLASLRSADDVDQRVSEAFGGQLNSIDEVESLSARELYAWVLLPNLGMGFAFTRVTSPEAREISVDRIILIVMKSGVRDYPQLEEEDIYRMTRVDGAWKIDL